MQSKADSPLKYIDELPDERKIPILKIRETILENIPSGFEETMGYGMIAYVVPFSRFPQGYHCNPNLPLPFVNLASQKNFIALYHMGLYSSPERIEWFKKEYSCQCKTKLDMGKSCIRFKKMDDIPYKLIGELMRMITVSEWIEYMSKFHPPKK